MSAINRFLGELNNSAFNKDFYQVDLSFESFVESLLMYINRDAYRDLVDGKITASDAIALIISSAPAFQRNNDKWTPDMQSLYVRNVMRGLRSSPIMLFTSDGTSRKTNCRIIDGLQRTTALLRYFTDDAMAFHGNSGDVITAGELRSNDLFNRSMMSRAIQMRVYSFNNEVEAVRFYIEMNEGITHSAEDIQKAKDYLATLL